jgi:hypothetical protein
MRMLNVIRSRLGAMERNRGARRRALEDPHVMGCSSHQLGLHHPGEGLK